MLSEIEIRHFPAQTVLRSTATTTMEDLGECLHALLPALFTHALACGGIPAGAPFTRFGSSQADGAMEIEACLPILSAIDHGDGIECIELPASSAASLIHSGPYETLGDAHLALGEFVRSQGLASAGLCWEQYITDPGREPDSAKWETLVCWPVHSS